MTHAHATTPRPAAITRNLATGLLLPAIYLIGVMCSYLPASHQPAPHNVRVAVAAPASVTARLQRAFDDKIPGGFSLLSEPTPQDARTTVLDGGAVAAYVPGAHRSQLYGAKADGLTLESVIRSAFTAAAQKTGSTLDFHELVPTVPGDVPGTSPYFIVLACVLCSYFVVLAVQRAAGLSRRAHVAILAGGGAVTAAVSYFSAAYALHAIPEHPLALLYLFLLTQSVSLTSYGLVPLFRGFSPAISAGLLVLLDMPSSGGIVPAGLVPGFFRFLHPVLPAGNAIDALRAVNYFGDQQLTRPDLVLCAWIVSGLGLVWLGYGLRRHELAREAAEASSEFMAEPRAEDPTVELPGPVALVPDHHHFGQRDPMLAGRVTGTAGQPLPGVVISVIAPRGYLAVRARTDENGEYKTTGLGEGYYLVVASDPDHEPSTIHVPIHAAVPAWHDFTLRQRRAGTEADETRRAEAHNSARAPSPYRHERTRAGASIYHGPGRLRRGGGVARGVKIRS
jgi:hypothetical protein